MIRRFSEDFVSDVVGFSLNFFSYSTIQRLPDPKLLSCSLSLDRKTLNELRNLFTKHLIDECGKKQSRRVVGSVLRASCRGSSSVENPVLVHDVQVLLYTSVPTIYLARP